MNRLLALGLALLSASFPVANYAWNANGHRLIAQIAYDQLTPEAKHLYNSYNHALDKKYKRLSFLDAAVWLDTLRAENNNTFSPIHYIDLSFSEDGTPLPQMAAVNAVTGIKEAIETLEQKSNSEESKGIALRILLHVVGDIHQPLHATSRVSEAFPLGDRGGQEVLLSNNQTLHAYWDNGAGYLFTGGGKRNTRREIIKKARQLELQYPCPASNGKEDPMRWAEESHDLAVKKAYHALMNNQVDARYRAEVRQCIQQRVVLAGCRLGALLNRLG